ncbi:hypothetical protein ACNKHX_05820 [Shigella flexneri]
MDRPDILARQHPHHRRQIPVPFLLSNGNKVAQGDLGDGRHLVQWPDPSRNRATCLPWWPGLRCGRGPYRHHAFGRKVALELYVTGNLDRAPWR